MKWCTICLITYHFLYHIHDFLLNKLEILSVAGRCATNNVLHSNIIIIFANAAAIHGVGKLDENGVLLHYALDMLAPNTNNTLMVLIRNMEGDRGRHFLFDQVKAVSCCFILGRAHINIEVVLVESVKDYLNMTLK